MGAHGVSVVLSLGIVAWVAQSWIRAKYGATHAAMAARDARIENLEQRIRVLERIATDGAAELERELERLERRT